MGIESRSQKGCWTCRVRKRKCDEKAPICSACKGLGLDCHGFGEQPAWMDRGAKQKAQATKIKQMVAEVRRQRRMNQILNQHEPSMKGPGSNSQSHDFSIGSALITTPTMPNQPFLAQESWFPLPSTGSFQSDGADSYFAPLHDIAVSDFLATGPTFSGSQASLDGMAFSLSDSYALEDDLISPHKIHLLSKGITMPNLANALEQTSGSGQLSHGNCTVTGNKSMLTIDKVEDATFLAYYFEKVFSWQFPFCQFHLPAFNQGHVMWLVSKSQPLYHATLALSSSHKRLRKALGGSSVCSSNDEHTPQYDLAIKELHNDLQDPKSYEEVSLLACIVMLLYSTLLYKSRSIDWHIHLQAGVSIVTSWIDHQDQKSMSLGHCQIDKEQESEANTNESAKVFLIGSIIRFDILSSLTRGSAPAVRGQYQRVLQVSRYGIHLEAALGCRNWLFSTLLDIYSLRDWKERTEAEGLLSLWELISKAHPIKKTLESGISLNLEEIAKQNLEVGQSQECRH